VGRFYKAACSGLVATSGLSPRLWAPRSGTACWALTWRHPPAPDGRWRAAAKVRPTGQDVPTTALKEPPSAPQMPRASLGGLRTPQIGARVAQKVRCATPRSPAARSQRAARESQRAPRRSPTLAHASIGGTLRFAGLTRRPKRVAGQAKSAVRKAQTAASEAACAAHRLATPACAPRRPHASP